MGKRYGDIELPDPFDNEEPQMSDVNKDTTQATDEQVEAIRREALHGISVWLGRPDTLERAEFIMRAEMKLSLIARIDTLTAENEKMKERESELIDRLSCIYSSLESMWLSDDFAEGFSEDSADESTLVRHSLFTGEVRMIHKILAPLRRTGQDCFLKGDV